MNEINEVEGTELAPTIGVRRHRHHKQQSPQRHQHDRHRRRRRRCRRHRRHHSQSYRYHSQRYHFHSHSHSHRYRYQDLTSDWLKNHERFDDVNDALLGGASNQPPVEVEVCVKILKIHSISSKSSR